VAILRNAKTTCLPVSLSLSPRFRRFLVDFRQSYSLCRFIKNFILFWLFLFFICFRDVSR
jgi:hypothetical protein